MKKMFLKSAAALTIMMAAHTASAEVLTGICRETAAACSYSLNTTDSTLTITGNSAIGYYSSDLGYTAPWYSNRSRIKYVVIEYGIRSTGRYAFYNCSALTSVTIPSSVTYIDESTFNGCSALTAINVDAANDYFSSQDGVLFNKTKTTLIRYPSSKTGTSYTIPSSVTTIGDWAFYQCNAMTSVTIPSSAGFIHVNNAFIYCTALTAINVDAANANYSSQDGVLFNKNKTTLIRYPAGKQGAYTIPSSVTTIGDWAFRECTALTSVSIPNSVTIIDPYAFYQCTALTSVSIPNSVTTIGHYAFYGCHALTSVSIGSGVTTIGTNAFYYCSALHSVTIENPIPITGIDNTTFTNPNDADLYVPDEAVEAYRTTEPWSTFSRIIAIGRMPAPVTYNCGYCGASDGCTPTNSVTATLNGYTLTISGTGQMKNFGSSSYLPQWYNYRNLITNVVIESGVTTIGNYTFSGCANLRSITIPNSVTSIGNSAFSGCDTLLRSITIPSSVTSIGNYAFSGCALRSITIPDGVTRIGDYAFSECTNLSYINILRISPPSLGTNAIPTNVNVIRVPRCPYAYRNASGWSAYASRIIGDEDAPAACQWNCGDHLYASPNYADSILTISGSGSMWNYPGSGTWNYYRNYFNTINIEEGVTSIGRNAFQDMERLTRVVVPSSVSRIAQNAFYGSMQLTSLTISASNARYQTIRGIVYSKNSDTIILCPQGRRTALLQDGAKVVGDSAFYGCSLLETIELPTSIAAIGMYAFYNAKVKPNSAATLTLSPYAFAYSRLENGILPHIAAIPPYAFYQCRMDSITIPNDCQRIEHHAFYYANYYRDNSNSYDSHHAWRVKMPSVKIIEPYAFANTGLAAAVNILNADTIYHHAFYEGFYGFYYPYYPTATIDAKYIGDSAFAASKISQVSLSVQYIGNYAFANSKITQVSLSDNLQYIGNYAFNNTALSSVVIPSSVEYMGAYAFANNHSMRQAIVMDGVQRISQRAFYDSYYESGSSYNSRKLLYVSMPSSVSSIGSYAFAAASSSSSSNQPTLTMLNMRPEPLNLNNEPTLFSGRQQDTMWVADTVAVDAYKNLAYWKVFSVILAVVNVTGITLNENEATLERNRTMQLIASIIPANATIKNVLWTSSNASVASVSASGVVTAVGDGVAVITATTVDGGFTAQCTIRAGNQTAVYAEPMQRLAVYPNPAGDMLYITDEYDGLVEIYDINGTLLLTSTSNNINISALPSGIYIVKAGGKSAKVVKQ